MSKARFWIEAADLLAMREFIDNDEFSPGPMRNCLVEVEPDPATDGVGRILTLVATNGHIMAVYKPDFEQPAPGEGGLDPGKYLLPLRSFDVMLFEGKKSYKDCFQVQVEIDPEEVRLSLRERGLSMTRKVDQANPEWQFPDYSKAIPAEESFKPAPWIAFDTEYLRRVKKAAHHTGCLKAIVRIRFTLEGGGEPLSQMEITVNGWAGFVAYLMPCRWLEA